MGEDLNITTERVDDIPVLLAHIGRMGIAELLDGHFATHGNWVGTSLGWTTAIWLAHILSRGDHRLSWVQKWVNDRLETLAHCTGQMVLASEWSDDRLSIVLDGLSEDAAWQAFEAALNRRTLRVYDLKPERVRVDSTTASGYWTVTEDGLFQFGHSKDHRPDLPQVKVMLSALDPLGIPVATQVISGECADDPLYVPAIQQVHNSLGMSGLLYIGDSKMAALATRAFVQGQRDYYLCPLSKKQLPDETLVAYLAPVWAGEVVPSPLYHTDATGQRQEIAVGFEREVTLTLDQGGAQAREEGILTWTERHLVVCSHQSAQASQQALRMRLAKAQVELAQLNERKQGRKRLATAAELHDAAMTLLAQHRLEGLVQLTITEEVEERPVRTYGAHPASVRREHILTLQAQVDEVALQEATRCLGWRVYATNHLPQFLPLEQAIAAYREEFLVEHNFGRLKGKSLSLTPMYLQSDRRATGLIRLLSIALRILTLFEFQVRRRLAEQNHALAGLYAGNPKRTTNRPTAEMLLEAFKNINLSKLVLNHQSLRHLSPLSDLQKKILTLLDFSTDIYVRLAADSLKPP
jgi:transposase